MKKILIQWILLFGILSSINANDFLKHQTLCDKKDGESCATLGHMYEYGNQVDKDLNTSIEFYTKSCNYGNSKGCNNVGNFYKRQKKFHMAASFFEKSCDNNNLDGCTMLGYMYGGGIGVKKDLNKSKKLLSKVCDQNQYRVCGELGHEYEKLKDYSNAVKLYNKSCKGGHGHSCYELGKLYRDGKSVEKSDVKAYIFFEMACENNYKYGCEEYYGLKTKLFD